MRRWRRRWRRKGGARRWCGSARRRGRWVGCRGCWAGRGLGRRLSSPLAAGGSLAASPLHHRFAAVPLPLRGRSGETLSPPRQRAAVEGVEVRLSCDRGLGEGDGLGQHRVRRVAVGRAREDRFVPAAAAGIVEQDALEAMVVADRPAARVRQRGQRDAGEPEPFRLQRGPRRVRRFADQGVSIAWRMASTETVQKLA